MPNALYRRAGQWAFFALFVLAPPLDILRLDLNLGHFIFFGYDWTLGLDAFQRHEIEGDEAAFRLITRGFLPLLALFGSGAIIAWFYGRLYCGWLCPHFSVVEMINGCMLRALGKPSLWERKSLTTKNALWWIPTLVLIFTFAFIWSLSLLTYLITPTDVYQHLWHAELTRFESLFLSVGTCLFCIEFTFARHFFCRFGCAIGLFQSVLWMANKKAQRVTFATSRAKACQSCVKACDNTCPMRLKPRGLKRKMSACTQCTRCIDACQEVQMDNPSRALLSWRKGNQPPEK